MVLREAELFVANYASHAVPALSALGAARLTLSPILSVIRCEKRATERTYDYDPEKPVLT